MADTFIKPFSGYILAVKYQGPALRRHHTEHSLQRRCFACTVAPYKGNCFTHTGFK